jgi:hypothetical protein
VDGLRVTSSFDINELQCSDLNGDIFQLGIILYPIELFNEKFLIKIRDCVLKLREEHPLKLWLKWVSETPVVTEKKQQALSFLSEIVNSQFNLITDIKVKTRIIELIGGVPEKTMYEKLLKAQLYLIIGNVTRSDNILKSIINLAPLDNWRGFSTRQSIYHRLSRDNFKAIMERLSRHPSDRKTLELLCLYFKAYFNDPTLLEIVNEISTKNLDKKLDLKYIEHLSPFFVRYLRIRNFESPRINTRLKDTVRFPIEMQMYWFWPFLNGEPVASQSLVMELAQLHEKDELWFTYLIDDDSLAQLYTSKIGKSSVSERRKFLRDRLEVESDYMLAFYKLLEYGDVDSTLVQKTVHFLIHD